MEYTNRNSCDKVYNLVRMFPVYGSFACDRSPISGIRTLKRTHSMDTMARNWMHTRMNFPNVLRMNFTQSAFTSDSVRV